jgi:hypothetical protein
MIGSIIEHASATLYISLNIIDHATVLHGTPASHTVNLNRDARRSCRRVSASRAARGPPPWIPVR